MSAAQHSFDVLFCLVVVGFSGQGCFFVLKFESLKGCYEGPLRGSMVFLVGGGKGWGFLGCLACFGVGALRGMIKLGF